MNGTLNSIYITLESLTYEEGFEINEFLFPETKLSTVFILL